VAVDGTKIHANASRHSALLYEHAGKIEAQLQADFYIRDEVLGPIVMRVASFFPFRTTYYLNGHSFIKHQLRHAKIGFRKNDNAFVAVGEITRPGCHEGLILRHPIDRRHRVTD
jgi:hypothetical protein